MSRHGPNLLTLPNEILQRILEDVHPDDVENVCLASKLLRVLGASRLREHEGLKSQYTELHISYEPQIPPFGGGDEGPEMRTAFQILYDISENPRIAYYPKYAELYSCDLVWDDRYIGDPATTENDQNIAKREVGFLSLAQACHYLSDIEASSLSAAIAEGNDDAAFALLLTLLTNVKSLTFWQEDPTEHIQFMVERIARATHSTSSDATPPSALSKLEEICLRHNDTENGESFDLFVPFALLPSLRSITGDMVMAGLDCAWPYAPLVSNVQTIDLSTSNIGDSLSKFLPGVRGLRVFKYDPAGLTICEAIVKPARVCEALLKHAGHSLEELRLGFDNGDSQLEDELDEVEEENNDEPEPSVRSRCPLYHLRSFQRLRIVEVDVRLFKTEDRDSDGDGDTEEHNTITPLIDVLPVSTEVLNLGGAYDFEVIKQLFRGLAEQRADRMPHLKSIQVETEGEKISKFVEEICEKIGVEFEAEVQE